MHDTDLDAKIVVPDLPTGEQDEALALDLTVRIQTTERLLALEQDLLYEAATAADTAARANIFTERQERKAWNTVKSEIAALSLFMTYLREAGVPLSFHLGEEPRLWQAITFGLVKGFLRWGQKLGYATKTRNDHLSVIKLYARLAKQAGMMEVGQLLDIISIPRVRGAEGTRIDRMRDKTRIGHKKPQPTFLERREEYQLLLERPKTPQGWRDKVAILLMYDLSLRPGEAVALRLDDLDLEEGTLHVYRQKTDDHQILRLTQRLQVALCNYLRLRQDRCARAPLLVRSLKNGELVEQVERREPEEERMRQGGRPPRSAVHQAFKQRFAPLASHEPVDGSRQWTPPMTTRALRERLHAIGLEIEETLYGDTRVENDRIHLTSYDGRHEWTRNAVRGGSDPIAVTKAGGWKGHSAMVARYYGELQIANEDIKLRR